MTFILKRLKRIYRTTRLPSGGHPPAKWRSFRMVNRTVCPPSSCELNVVDHCNIACLDCNHASPVVDKGFADPATVYNDFSKLARYYRPQYVKLIGGEPLLHPDLRSLIDAVRLSGICSQVRLVTNGLLLHLMPETVWKALDGIEISRYPDVYLPENKLKELRQTAERHHVALDLHHYAAFRITFSSIGTNDTRLVRRIYQTCKLANLWGCQSIHRGFFYKCPQSIYISQTFGAAGSRPCWNDGLKIDDSDDFFHDLVAYLSSRKPLKACRHCLGYVGKQRPHRLVGKDDWMTAHHHATETLVDYEKLASLEAGIDV